MHNLGANLSDNEIDQMIEEADLGFVIIL